MRPVSRELVGLGTRHLSHSTPGYPQFPSLIFSPLGFPSPCPSLTYRPAVSVAIFWSLPFTTWPSGPYVGGTMGPSRPCENPLGPSQTQVLGGQVSLSFLNE